MDSASSRVSIASPQKSMTLSISRENALRMLSASQALNQSVARLQEKAQEEPKAKEKSPVDTNTNDKAKESNETNTEDQVPKRVVSVSDSGSVSSSEETHIAGTASKTETKDISSPPPVHEVLLEAAATCGNELIDAFLTRMQAEKTPDYEIESCLLLFLDMDKSTKLLTAFKVLSEATSRSQGQNEAPAEDEKKTEATESKKPDAMEVENAKNCVDDKSPLLVDYKRATILFKSFLTSISIFIHHEFSIPRKRDSSSSKDSEEQPRKAKKENEQSSPTSSTKSVEEGDADEEGATLPSMSPSFDSANLESSDSSKRLSESLPEKTIKEVQEIATFAADRLLEHVRKKKEGTSLIPFEDFGEWYNSGGFSTVPWLELLDLAKWKYAGKPAVDEKQPSVSTKKTALATIKEEPEKSPASRSDKSEPKPSPPTNFFKTSGAETHQAPPTSRVLVSFDFTGAMSSSGGNKRPPFSISITEENLLMLRNLVSRTGIATRSPEYVCNVLHRHSTERVLETGSVMVLHRDDFGRCIRDLVPAEASRRFSRFEMENFSAFFTNFFTCFDNGVQGPDQVNVKELAVGFSFLCTGNKSAKLAAGFELLQDKRAGKLTKRQLTQYLRSYLTMLVGISLLCGTPAGMADVKKILRGPRREEMSAALENGAKWTLGHFLKDFVKSASDKDVRVSFEDFARWYTDGGFNIAPWLELLDLSKLLTLLGDGSAPSARNRPSNGHSSHQKAFNTFNFPEARSPRQRRPQDAPPIPPVEVLFTFPLANRRSLVVLREDATYVRSVVEKLGLVNMFPEDVWSSLYNGVKFHPPRPTQPWSRTNRVGKTMDVDQVTFVSGMEGVIISKSAGRKRPATGGAKVSASTKETLVNFFHSFDLDQVDRVPLNQLMGGLALLCGGKKSTKLAFAFGLFDGRNDGKSDKGSPGQQPNALDGEELFLFLRSFLIVMFSCCRQSLDLSAEAVGRYIADTSHMVTEDVMRYQWHTNKRDRVDFDEFGEWYNEGGFETAPWLELLDLQKWVLMDNVESGGAPSSARAPPANMPLHAREGFHGGPSPRHLERSPRDYDCPPPPPDDAVDPSFFGDDENGIMPLGSMDEMDYILMQQPSQDKENEGSNANRVLLPLSPHHRDARNGQASNCNSLKFHLVTNEDHGGYMLSISQRRVRHVRHLLVESALCKIDAELACKKILGQAQIVRTNGKSKTNGAAEMDMLALSKDDFDSAIRSIIGGGRGKPSMSPDTQRTLSDLFNCIFTSFDRSQTGMPSAMEVACGFMVLCNGKKSDKLEYAFELLDSDKDGKLSRRDMGNYLRSFLTALLSIASASCLDFDENEDNITLMNGNRCDRSASLDARAVDAGSSWAASQAFKIGFKGKSDCETITFDDFAEWYTNVGYSSIPWLELLDLRKWVLVDS